MKKYLNYLSCVWEWLVFPMLFRGARLSESDNKGREFTKSHQRFTSAFLFLLPNPFLCAFLDNQELVALKTLKVRPKLEEPGRGGSKGKQWLFSEVLFFFFFFQFLHSGYWVPTLYNHCTLCQEYEDGNMCSHCGEHTDIDSSDMYRQL